MPSPGMSRRPPSRKRGLSRPTVKPRRKTRTQILRIPSTLKQSRPVSAVPPRVNFPARSASEQISRTGRRSFQEDTALSTPQGWKSITSPYITRSSLGRIVVASARSAKTSSGLKEKKRPTNNCSTTSARSRVVAGEKVVLKDETNQKLPPLLELCFEKLAKMVQCTQPPPQLKLPETKMTELTDDENHDSPPKPERRTRMHHIERHRSCVVTLSDIELNGLQPRRLLQTIEISKSPGGGSQCSLYEETPRDLCQIVYFRGQPISTVAIDKSQGAALNYDQVFMRDFIPSVLAFLMKGEHLIVKNFLVETARLQSREKMVDLFKLGQGVMPASFKVHHRNPTQKTESLLADFGETSIGSFAPVDSGLWWIILLRAYTKWTGDNSLAKSPNCQRAMHLILRLCFSEGCDTSPGFLCADGCSMIDRRMGKYGYPIEIQALLFMAMRCALSLLKQVSDADFVHHITKRNEALRYHLHSYYWLDFQRLNDIYRCKTEEYSQTALNKFNVIPESIPNWIFDFMPSWAGYLIGNVSPARMDFRWFCLGNFVAILSSLSIGEQAEAILDLIEECWQKLCYPAMESQEWQIVTGCDPKNTRWSDQNAALWPVLLWLLVAVSVKPGRPHLAQRAVELMEQRLAKDDFPEYYDGKVGRYMGKQARKFQTWSMAGYLVAKMLLDGPSHLRIVMLLDDSHSRALFLKHSNSCL